MSKIEEHVNGLKEAVKTGSQEEIDKHEAAILGYTSRLLQLLVQASEAIEVLQAQRDSLVKMLRSVGEALG